MRAVLAGMVGGLAVVVAFYAVVIVALRAGEPPEVGHRA